MQSLGNKLSSDFDKLSEFCNNKPKLTFAMAAKIKTVKFATPSNFEEVLNFLRKRFKTLNDEEIFKFALNELYYQEINAKQDPEQNWLKLASSSPSFDFLKDEKEDIYSL